MFDRCDTDTGAIIDAALSESRRRGHNWLGTEHVLLALAQRRELLPPEVAAILPDADTVATALDAALDEPPRRDAELLRAVGIDLESVRSSVRRTFGDSALEDLGRRRIRQPWQPWRRPTRRCMSILAGSVSHNADLAADRICIAPRLKRAFEHSRRDADRRKRATIDPAALLLGMVEVEEAMSNQILHRVGVDPQLLRQSLRALGA